MACRASGIDFTLDTFSISGTRADDAPDKWPRLAAAATNARDALRLLAAELSLALQQGGISQALVERARDIAAHHAAKLGSAIKHPGGPDSKKRKHNRHALPCWTDQEAS